MIILILYIIISNFKIAQVVLQQQIDNKRIAKPNQARVRFIRIGPYQSQKPVIVKTSSATPIRVV